MVDQASSDKVTERWRMQLDGLIPEYAAEVRKAEAARKNGNHLRNEKHARRADRLDAMIRFRVEGLAKLVEIGEPAMPTESDLSRITRNGDFVAGFDTRETSARFTAMLMEIFPNDVIELNGNRVNPLDGPTSWRDIMERWLPDEENGEKSERSRGTSDGASVSIPDGGLELDAAPEE